MGHTLHRALFNPHPRLRQPHPRRPGVNSDHHRHSNPTRRRADSALPLLAQTAWPLARRLPHIPPRDFEVAAGVVVGSDFVGWSWWVYGAGLYLIRR